jgi:hypothetical protein
MAKSKSQRRSDRDDPERAPLLPATPTTDGPPVDVFALVHHVRHLLKVPASLPNLLDPRRRRLFRSRLTGLHAVCYHSAEQRRHDPHLGAAPGARRQLHAHPAARRPALGPPQPGHPSVPPSLPRGPRGLTLMPISCACLRRPVYALLINRMYFSRLAETDLSYSSLQATRAGTLSAHDSAV